MATKTKVCTKCNQRKLISDFYIQSRRTPQLHRSQCKECTRSELVIWRKNNPTKVAKHRKKDAWTLAKKCSRRGIAEQKLRAMYEDQKGKCPICTTGIELMSSALDHNHETGEFRGLLCSTCNRGLGMLRDSITNLRRAIKYLQDKGSYAKE